MAERGKPVFNYDLCMACGICMHACAFGSLEMQKIDVDKLKKAYPELDKPESCTGCKQCEKACPVEAIEVKL